MNQLYKQIEQAIRNHASQLSVAKGITQDEVYQNIRYIMRENPDIFWFSHQWKYTENDHIIRFCYTISKEKSLKAKAQIEDVVQKDFHIDEVFRLSVPKQVMYVYKWIALYCKYNIYSAYNQTMYSVFVYRNSVCTGYAKAAQYLFRILGIESKLVFGTMNNAEKGSRHCWLVVGINGLWYHIDPTFAVPEINDLLCEAGVKPIYGSEGLVYNFFCCDTKSIKQSRIIEDEEELPPCYSTIDFKSLHDLPIKRYRTPGAEQQGVRGCILNDSGSTASVYLWHSDKSMQNVVKVYKNDASHVLLRHEYQVMCEIASSHSVVHVCGITENRNGLIIEQVTPLADLLCSHYYQLSAIHFCKLLLDVLAGLQDCIKHGIYYRDIHLNNIYRTSKGHYVLGDFGSCIWMKRENPLNIGGVGSPWYLAPETYTKSVFNEQSSTYGIGMLAYFLLNELVPPLWTEYGEESFKFRVSGRELPSPVLLKKPSCAFEQQLATVIKKALSFESVERFQKLSDLKKAIKQCISLLGDDDYLLIDGGSSKRLIEFGKKKEVFHSTCMYSPDIIVSNGENEPIILVDVDVDGQMNTMQFDINQEDSIDENEMIDTICSNIDDFAYTAGNPCNHVESDNSISEEASKNFLSLKGSNAKGTYKRSRIDDFALTNYKHCDFPEMLKTYQPSYNDLHLCKESFKNSLWHKLFRKKGKKAKVDEVFSSVFAPSEIKPKSHFMVQVYLHLLEEAENVIRWALEADSKAERRKYFPLRANLKVGDNVNVELNIYGESLLQSFYQTVVWRGHFTQCDFDYFVPVDLNVEDLSCEVNFYVNGALIGDMRFITNIVEQPRKLNPEIISRMFKQIFISYAHQDSIRVKDFALAYKAQGVDYFFDRDKLAAGDVYEEKIFEYIDSADLFILCWSANAANSEYVGKERRRAMLRAYPQLSHRDATLKIYPISIEPRAELPKDMIDIYNFEEV